MADESLTSVLGPDYLWVCVPGDPSNPVQADIVQAKKRVLVMSRLAPGFVVQTQLSKRQAARVQSSNVQSPPTLSRVKLQHSNRHSTNFVLRKDVPGNVQSTKRTSAKSAQLNKPQ